MLPHGRIDPEGLTVFRYDPRYLWSFDTTPLIPLTSHNILPMPQVSHRAQRAVVYHLSNLFNFLKDETQFASMGGASSANEQPM